MWTSRNESHEIPYPLLPCNNTHYDQSMNIRDQGPSTIIIPSTKHDYHLLLTHEYPRKMMNHVNALTTIPYKVVPPQL